MSRTRMNLSRQAVFQTLETRKLLSQINVADFGARPNDGGDDRGAIIAAINASQNGDTILFPGGTFNLSSSISPKGNRTYTGLDGAKIVNNNGPRIIFYISEDNVSINKLTLEGQGIETRRNDNQMVAGLNVDNVTFNVANGPNICGIEFNTGLRNGRITNNTFNIAGENGIYGYYWDKLLIANNDFLNGGEGIHVIDCNDTSHDLIVEQNHFSGLHRMGIEYQGGGWSTVVQDNYYEKPVVYPNFNANNDTFAYSIIADKSHNTITRRNTSITYDRADGVGTRIVFEIGGNGAICEDNYSDGGNHVVAVNGGSGAQVRNNKFKGYRQGPGVGGSGRNATFANNTPDVGLTWNINRGIPGPNKRIGLNGPVDQKAPIEQKPPVDQKKPDGAPPVLKNPKPSTDQNPDKPLPTPADKPQYEPGDFTYLSDLKPVSAASGWGPLEIDRANGERRNDDGGALTLDGKTYAKGLGVAIDSKVVYDLDGKYSRFFSDIGIDDATEGEGSMTFEVWADGAKVFNSGLMTGQTDRKGITLKVDGVKELALVTTNAGDGDRHDHGDWAAARLVADRPRV